jgi:hypothetical protein
MTKDIWIKYFNKIINPIFNNFNKNNFQEEFIKNAEYGNYWDKRPKEWSFMELICRILVGLSFHLEKNKELFNQSIKIIYRIFDEQDKLFINWIHNKENRQPMVEIAYLCQTFLNCPKLWQEIKIKNKILKTMEMISLIEPYQNNWILFETLILIFLQKNNIITDKIKNNKIYQNLEQFDKLYIGDGWYSDGKSFMFNYYNSFVIYPFLLQIHLELKHPKLKIIIERMQLQTIFLEKFIHPDGTFPIFGRSPVYRLACFNCLTYLIYYNLLPKELNYGNIRELLTKIIINFFEGNQNFTKENYLTLGFNGNQKEIANNYSNTGSCYLTLIPFMVLNLEDNHPFWKENKEKEKEKSSWEKFWNL